MAAKHFLIPEGLARRIPALRTIGWKLEAWVIRALIVLMNAMSVERAARFASFVFRQLKPVLPFTRKIRNNLSVAFPEKDAREIERLTRSTCSNLGQAAAELILAGKIWAERDKRIEFVVEGGTDLAGYQGRPAVMVTGHIGAWQVGAFIAAQYQLPITSVYAPEENPYLRELFLQLRSALPISWIPRDGSMRELMKELKRGHVVGLVSDTRLDSGAAIPFFGVPTPANTAAARLAIRNNCPFFPVHAERLPGMHFRITLCRPIVPDDSTAPAAEQAQEMTRALFEHFEKWIRESPDQWMCFGRRWPHDVYANFTSPAGHGGSG